MNTTNRSLNLAITSASLTVWINRALESLWLLTAVLVPLAFFDPEYALSEAAIAYVEVPKVALLHTLVGLMAVLWLIEWGIQGRLSFGDLFSSRDSRFLSAYWLKRMKGWLQERPNRWLFLAVWFFLGSTLLSTILSQSFSVSAWGEVPGQDGYPAYTVVAYVLLFGVIATHLRTKAQFSRLIGALVLMGVLVAGYGILQHYGHDFLDLSEISGGGANRVTSFMGNTIFAAAVMSMTVPLTLVAATITFRDPVWPTGGHWEELRALAPTLAVTGLWAVVLTIQLLGLTFTFSRGPWVGMMVAVMGFLGLAVIFAGWRSAGRASLVLSLTGVLTLALLQGLGSISILGLGPWLGGAIAIAGLIGLALFFVGWRYFGRVIFLLILAGVLAGAVLLAPSWLESSAATGGDQDGAPATASDSTGAQVAERFSSIKKDVRSGLFAGRGTHWSGSWRLIRDRPWFNFDSLSLPWLRPIIGYGPDLFRYTYLLESPSEGINHLPLEPDHAHNFFIHQTVEQGFLGLLASVGLFAAAFSAGGYLLFRRGREIPPFHKLILIGLLAITAGRFVEMMVGVARVSDLTVLWVVFGALAALVGTMQTQDKETEEVTPRLNSPRPNRRRRVSTSTEQVLPWQHFWRLAVVAWLIGGIGVLLWIKDINNVRAAVQVGDAIERFRNEDYQGALADLDQAIELAPDISVYYNHRALIYRAYQLNTRVPPEQGCSAQKNLPYEVCLAGKGLQSNLEGAGRRPFYYRSRLALAQSAYNLNLNQEAVRYYKETLALVPDSWRLRNELAKAYLETGQPQAALGVLEESLAITNNTSTPSLSVTAYFLQGRAYRDQGNLIESAVSLERSLELGLGEKSKLQAREDLGEVYLSLNQPELAAQVFFQLGVDYRKLIPGESFQFFQGRRVVPKSSTPSGQAGQIPTGLVITPADDLTKSATALERSLELGISRDAELEAHQHLAEVYMGLGEPQLAAESLFLLGEAYRDRGKLEESAQSLEQSLEVALSGRLTDQAHQALAEVYTALGRLAEAEKHRQSEKP